MPDYSKSKIYKIFCNLTGETYYGSTVQPLYKRVSEHKGDFKRWKNGKFTYVKSFDIIERGDYTYSLVEHFPCDSKEELHARERYWIENNECVNKYIPGRTKEEYREQNKEKMKEYREQNKEHIREYEKEYREQNKEHIREQKKEYYEQNKEKIKEYREQNKEKINEDRRKQKIVCECGSEVRKDNLARHKKTKKHLDGVESQCE